ncbi:12620_t:CDS:1 [Funneliformis mosseae]|uniref:12620_t:CDS:1 n=1 Tax=Funneliformis mosseae TaxID=27381 RepID=A0A9N8WDR2_FUNMO|nr:12620_t:CDS:1 [Funneliformis mosseae]
MLDFVHYQDGATCIPDDINVQLPLRLFDDDLLAKPRRGRIPTRPPNNFLIFRTAYTRVLQSRGFWDLRMREVTRRAAKAWSDASADVKAECRRLASHAKKRHEEVYGPPPKRTRKRRQNVARLENNAEQIPITDAMVFPTPQPASFFYEDIITPSFNWQPEITYQMFSPNSDEDNQQQYTAIYPEI